MAGKNRQTGQVPRAWIGIAALVVLALLVLNIVVEFARESKDQAGAAGPTATSVNRTDELRLRGWATRSRIPPSGSVRVYVTLENRSDQRLEDIRLSLEGEGFVSSGPIPLGTLGPGKAITQPANLTASSEPSSGIITSLVEWKSGSLQAKTTLAIGPVEVRREKGAASLLASSVLAFFKDLALPIVLVLVAYAVQYLQQEKTGHQETFHAMLPRAHENIVRFLLPMVASANRFLGRLDAARGSGPEKELALQQTFFYLLSIAKEMRNLVQQGGGIFFTSIPGETAVSLCWKECVMSMEKELGAREMSEILDEWGRAESFTSLQKRFKSRSSTLFADPIRTSFADMEEKFKDWIERDFDYQRRLLEVFRDVMQYEIDKIYGPWYKTEPTYEEESKRNLQELEERADASQNTKLAQALKEFGESIEPERQKFRSVKSSQSGEPSGAPPKESNQEAAGVSTPPHQGEQSGSSNSPAKPPIPPR